jgi:hypothetical protein
VGRESQRLERRDPREFVRRLDQLYQGGNV